MVEELIDLYADAGVWANPILISTALLFVVGSVMLFIVRMIKRFVLFTLIAFVLPNGIGVVGYLDEVDSLEEAVMERGTELTEEMIESAEDLTWSPMYLSLLGSLVPVGLGIVGIARSRRSKPPPAAPGRQT